MATKCLLLLLTMFFIGCGGDSPGTVHAQTADCSGPEQFAEGAQRPDLSRVKETADYLQFASPVCRSNGFTMTTSYTLLFDHHVQLIDMQMGSGLSNTLHPGQPIDPSPDLRPEIFEWAWWVQFDTPAGHHYEFFQQFDKHSDFRGNQNVKIPLPHGLTFPAGTMVTLSRPPGAATDGQTQTHITGQKVELVGD